MPRYPVISLAPSGVAVTIVDALEEAVATEVQGLIRERGQEAACKAAVHACVDVGKEIRRQAMDIGIDLDPAPRVDLKELRRVFEEEKLRQEAQIEEEESLWASEEAKYLDLTESNKLAQAKVQGLDERSAEECGAASGFHDTKCALDPLDEEETSSVHSEGAGTAKRVSNELLASTNEMLLNASSIGRCLQEMGAGFADAQEAKERLARAYQHQGFKNYPNFDDPKAGIAALLK